MASTSVAAQGSHQILDRNIYFCERGGEVSVHTRKMLNRETWQSIRSLEQLRTGYNWIILYFFLQGVLAGWAILTTDLLLVRAVGWFLIACSVNALPILMHDACHSLLSKNSTLNRWLGFIAGVPGLVSVSAYRSIHLAHHGHTRTEADPDDIENSITNSIPAVLVYYVVMFVGIYIYLFTVPIVGYQKANAGLRRKVAVEYSIMALIYGAVFFLVPFEAVLQLWLIPLLIAGQLSNVRGLAEHGMTTSGNEFIDTRTVISNPFVRFMMCNLNFHLEHHLFPAVPWYNLPKLHRLLVESYPRVGASVYRSYTSFVVDFIRTTFGGVHKNMRLIPKHIREEVCL
jgi:fatty acid desaturase